MAKINSDIVRLYQLAKPYKRMYVYGVLFTIAVYSITFAIPMQIKKFIDTGIASDSMSVIIPIVGFIVLLKALMQVSNIGMHYFFTVFENIFTRDTQTILLKHIMGVEYSKFKSFGTGDVISRVNDDIKSIERFMAIDLSSLIKNYVVTAIGLGVLFYLSVPLTLAALPLLILVPFCMDLIKKRVREANDKIRHSNGKVVSTIEQILSGLFIIRSHSYENLFIQEYTSHANSIIHNRKKMALYQGLSGAIAEIVIALILFGVVFGFGGYLVIHGKFTTGGIIAYYTYMGMLLGPVVSIFKTKLTVQRVMSSVDRIDELLDLNSIESITRGIKQVAIDKEEPKLIECKNITFGYDTTSVLKNISLSIGKGEKIGLVGSNGSGKSTLILLLLGLEADYSGSIEVDGHDIRGVTNLSEIISVVPQEAFLFGDSVCNNLNMGVNVCASSITHQLQQLGIDYVPDINMKISDRGSSLSGGERQRLCIARALVRNTPVIILDEISNNLDVASEKHMYNVVSTEFSQNTVIVATHRLDVLKNFDRIYVLKEGRIIEHGTYEDLNISGSEFSGELHSAENTKLS